VQIIGVRVKIRYLYESIGSVSIDLNFIAIPKITDDAATGMAGQHAAGYSGRESGKRIAH
jgi:hypothetical protein